MLWTTASHAQAWLPDGGTTSIGVSHTNTLVDHSVSLIYGYGFFGFRPNH